MEALLPPAQHDGLHAPFGPKPFGGLGDRRFSSPDLLANAAHLFCGAGYPTHHYPYGCSSPVSSSASPSPRSRSYSDLGSVVDDADDDSPAAAEDLRARLDLQYHEAATRYQLCFSHLADTTDEAAALRRENDRIRSANGDLARRIAVFGGKHGSALALAHEFRRLNLAEEQAKAVPPPPPPPAAMTMMRPVVPDAMPKSISVRSTGYVKMNPRGKHRASNTNNAASSQRVFVGVDGGAKGEDKEKKDQGARGIELEVYNQGMFKTELCNNWEEAGACSYGDRCQFAHGVAELRPVIRHPRYKTQVCRMVLAGGLCPYGHRCHFRHSLSPADGHLRYH